MVFAELTLAGTGVDRLLIEALASELSGEILLSGDEAYEARRAVWNGAIDRHPALIVRPAGVADIQAAVRFAVDNDLPLSVRSGGHGYSGAAVVDHGVMIDLALMQAVSVDPEQRIARVQTGATWVEFNRATQPYGLTIPSGKLSSPGVGGVGLGGGIGWLARKYGMAIDHVRSAELVTATGDILSVSANENADLFWAIRGGGGNFGVVASFEFDLVPVASVYGGMVAYLYPQASQLLQTYRAATQSAPDELTTMAMLMVGPDGSKIAAFAAVYAGDETTGKQAVEPFISFAQPIMNDLALVPYGATVDKLNAMAPAGFGRLSRSGFLREFSNEVIKLVVDAFAVVPCPIAEIFVEHYGGQMARIDPAATAFPHRREELNLVIDLGWMAPEQKDLTERWLTELWDALHPYLSGSVYVGYLGSEGPERVKAAYGDNYPRLAEIKRRYDPTNLFRMNQNILPE